MKNIIALALVATLAACGAQPEGADERQSKATKASLDAADREIGMPRISNFAQRKLLKNAYEDMDQTTLTYVYVQSLDGRFLCLGQAIGYGVSMGTQFTAPYVVGGNTYGSWETPQAEPNGLFMPTSGAATIVNLIDSTTGKARTSLVEPNVITTPSRLPASVVSSPCPADVDPSKVVDAKETGSIAQRN